MREEYLGREVALGAIQPLLDALRSFPEGTSRLAELSARDTRISWDVFCELLELARTRQPDLRALGAATMTNVAYKHGRRLRLARLALTLDHAVRFMVYPPGPVDFASINMAVTSEPGRVDFVAYVVEPYAPSPAFFEFMLGAGEVMLRLFEGPEGKLSMRTSSRQAHFVATFPCARGLRARARRFVSGRLLSAYSLYALRTAYPELAKGREMYEEQLVARAQLEDELSASQQAFERRMEHVDDVIGELDAEGRLVYVSPNFQEMIGLTTEEALVYMRRVVHREDMDRVAEGVREALRRGVSTRLEDFRALGKDRSGLWVELRLDPVVTSDGSKRTLVVARNVTEQHTYLEERQELDRQLEQTQRLESLGVLAGGIAHDFNNLLVPIAGFAELASAQLEDRPEVRGQVDIIKVAADKAADLVRQLTVYAGKQPTSFSTVDLGRETRELLDLLKTSISPKVDFHVELDEDAHVLGDVSQLRQVAMNLVINAAEAIGDQPGTIKLTVRRVGPTVTLCVCDDGCGMDEVARSRAFEPFFSTKFAGRGLGLSAVMGIVKAHSGQLTLDSEPGKGTQIVLTLEAVREAAPEPGRVELGQREGRVLLVDDEELVRQAGERMLESLGYEVDLAKDGEQALVMSRDGGYAALVVDLMMPKVNGREVLAEVRRRQPQQPVLLVSGYGAQLAKLNLADPYTRFLGKPYRAHDLGAILAELIDSPA